MLNKENLLAAEKFVREIPSRLFDMELYREDASDSIVCNSVGCALGHLPALFPELTPFTGEGEIMFWEIPFEFFGMEDDKAINYCFASEWDKIDNTPTGCADRIRLVADYGEAAARELWKQVCKDHKIVF